MQQEEQLKKEKKKTKKKSKRLHSLRKGRHAQSSAFFGVFWVVLSGFMMNMMVLCWFLVVLCWFLMVL